MFHSKTDIRKIERLRPHCPVYGKDLSGYVAGKVACQEQEGIGDVLRLSDSPQGDGVDQRLDHFLWKGGHHVGVGDARATALTRMLLGPSSLARDQVIPLTADLLTG